MGTIGLVGDSRFCAMGSIRTRFQTRPPGYGTLTGMNTQEKGVDGVLARALSGDSACPVPNVHDKTNEAHYFLHE